jgi:hypothetical protein
LLQRIAAAFIAMTGVRAIIPSRNDTFLLQLIAGALVGVRGAQPPPAGPTILVMIINWFKKLIGR